MRWGSFFLFLALVTPVPAFANDGGQDLEIGLTFFEIGQYERAAVYLERAVKAQPGDSGAAVAYGITLQKLGRNAEAVTWLTSADLSGSQGANGAYYLGEAYRALDRQAEARDAFRLSARLNGPLSTRALLEAGRSSSAMGDYEGARADFQRVLDLQAAGDLVDEARAGLALLSASRPAFAASADIGLRYDSNVKLEQKSSGDSGGLRAVTNLLGRYRLLETGNFRSEVALGVNQGRYLKSDLRPLDLGVQNVNVEGTYKLGSLPVRIGAKATGSYETLDFGSYAAGYGGGPRIVVAEGKHLATIVAWDWRKDDFSGLNGGRDAVQRTSSVSQFAFWGTAGYAGAGFSYQQNRAVDGDFTYDVAAGRIFAGNEVGPGILLDGGLDVVATPYLAQARSERTFLLSGGVGKYWKTLGVRLSGGWVRNRGAESAGPGGLDYSKFITGLDLRVRY